MTIGAILSGVFCFSVCIIAFRAGVNIGKNSVTEKIVWYNDKIIDEFMTGKRRDITYGEFLDWFAHEVFYGEKHMAKTSASSIIL